MKQLRPALNSGIQYAYLDAMTETKGNWDEDDYEEVYMDVVLDGYGKIKKDPIHVFVQEVMRKGKISSTPFFPSGVIGFLEMLSPPYTSEDPELRSRQILFIMAASGTRFYRFIIQQIGSCPTLVLGSMEPSTKKTSTAILALKIVSDSALLMAPGSTVAAVDMLKSVTSNSNLLDDIEDVNARHNIIMDGFNGAPKTTIERGEEIKLGGQYLTLNFTLKDKLIPKEDEGRTWILIMNKSLQSLDNDFDKEHEAQVAHHDAMRSRGAPRDFLAYLGCRVFSKKEDELSIFQRTHKEAKRIMHNSKPNYEPRKLCTYSLPLTMFLILQGEIELIKESKVEAVNLWTKAVGSREKFLENYMKELEKTDVKVEEMLAQNFRKRKFHEGCPGCSCGEKEKVARKEAPTQKMTWGEVEVKIEEIVDKIKESGEDIIRVKRVLMIHNEMDGIQNLSIAHNRCEKSYIGKSWKEIGIQSSGFLTGPKNKIFVKLDSMEDRGQGTGTVYCYQVNMERFGDELKERLRRLLKPKQLEKIQESVQEAMSQDFPEICKSTLSFKCQLCDFTMTNKEVIKDHMKKEHEKCVLCMQYFMNNDELVDHTEKDHVSFNCPICKKEVPVKNNNKSHMEYHNKEDIYLEVLEKGKVSKMKPKEKKVDLKEAWYNYQRIQKTIVKEVIYKEHPEKSAKDKNSLITRDVSASWKCMSSADKEKWARQAKLKTVEIEIAVAMDVVTKVVEEQSSNENDMKRHMEQVRVNEENGDDILLVENDGDKVELSENADDQEEEGLYFKKARHHKEQTMYKKQGGVRSRPCIRSKPCISSKPCIRSKLCIRSRPCITSKVDKKHTMYN